MKPHIFKTHTEAEIFCRGMAGYKVKPFINDDGERRYRVMFGTKTLREGYVFA